eukprot:5508286-Pyramimonas_sp.AAC.1
MQGITPVGALCTSSASTHWGVRRVPSGHAAEETVGRRKRRKSSRRSLRADSSSSTSDRRQRPQIGLMLMFGTGPSMLRILRLMPTA